MSRKVERAIKKFPELLPLYANNISEVCRKLKISRTWYRNRYEKDKDFRERIDEVMEAEIDHVECKLQEQINEGNVTAIIFFLKNKAQHRGYKEKELDGGLTQNFRIMIDDVKQIQSGGEDEVIVVGDK